MKYVAKDRVWTISFYTDDECRNVSFTQVFTVQDKDRVVEYHQRKGTLRDVEYYSLVN